MKRAEVVQQQYPRYSLVTKELIREAEHLFSNALTEADEAKKITAMNEANKLLSRKYIRDLFQLDVRIDEAKSLCDKIVKEHLGTDQTISALYDRAILDEKIAKLQDQLKQISPTSYDMADMTVTRSIKPLNDYIKELKKVVQASNQKTDSM